MSHNVLPKRAKNLAGLRFGRLVAQHYEYTSQTRAAMWRVVCDCGTSLIVRGDALSAGKSLSCGCWKAEATKTHGHAGSPTYVSWNNMMQRCTNPDRDDYKDYGGRGIQVHKPWYDFATFLADMGEKPYATASIERLDNDGNYNPRNCVWADKSVQSRNKRSSQFVVVNGSRVILADACKLRKVSRQTVYNRMRRGLTMQQAIDAPDGRL